jgi:hypothetical protein
MKLQRTFVCITGALFAVCFAASQASAGSPSGECSSGGIDGMTIEVNALRAGGKTLNAGPNQSILVTAKARILKGTALSTQVIDTTLTIEFLDNDGIIIGDAMSGFEEIRLGVGKGGQGDKLPVDLPSCGADGSVDLRASFFGTDGEDDPCTGTKTIRKLCQRSR